MSSSNLVTARIIEETSWGVVPASAMQNINVRQPQLKRQRTPQTPPIIRGDRRRYASRILGEQGNLSIATILQYLNSDPMLEGFQNGDWGSNITVTAATISFNSGTKVIADSGNGLGSFAVGDILFITGAASAVNNGAHGLVTAAAAGSLTVQSTLVTAAAGDAITISTQRLYDGVTLKSYAYEDEYGDLTTTLRGGKGFRFGEMGLSWSVDNWVEQTFTAIGNVPSMMNATFGTGAPTAAATSGFLSSLSTDFTEFWEGGAASSLIVTKFDLRGINQQALRKGIASGQGPSGVDVFGQDISIDMNMYWDANARTLVEKAEAHTATSLWWAVADPEGNRMGFALAACKPDEGDPEIPGPDANNMATVKLTAYKSATYPYQFAMFRRAA